jgi:hypothetical protein
MENRTGKYFKYAIGEIILVVVGILIALSINNWNENIKNQKFEQKVLNEILLDTKEDISETTNSLVGIQDSEHSNSIILNALNSKLAYNDSLNVHFAKALRFWSLSPNSTAFEAIKTEGLYHIKNDSIRQLVSKLNTYLFDYIKVLESRQQDYNMNIIQPRIVAQFDYYNSESMTPNNYGTLKTDLEYQGILKTLSSMRKRYAEMLKLRLNWLTRLDGQIEEDLDVNYN